MSTTRFNSKFNGNLVALLSFVAIASTLFYSIWRFEKSEKNQNTRLAAFEVLKNLGQLQLVVNYNHYAPENSMGNPLLGWGYIAIISDLSQLLPPPIPETTQKLVATWEKNWSDIQKNEEAVQQTSQEIDLTRAAVLGLLKSIQ